MDLCARFALHARLSAIGMHVTSETRIATLVAFVAAAAILRILVWWLTPETAQKLVPWTNRLVWIFWVGSAALTLLAFWDKPYLIGIGIMIYATALLSRNWVKSRAQFEEPGRVGFRIFPNLLRIPSRTYIGVRDLASSTAWYTQKLGLRKLAQSPEFEEKTVSLNFGEADDERLILGPPLPVQGTPILQSWKLAKAKDLLGARGVEVGAIEKDRQGTSYFEFRDLEGNKIEVCSNT
jgi:catechol 2,3-dioxygenase-like lactoylglutathione lyase family enzyme